MLARLYVNAAVAAPDARQHLCDQALELLERAFLDLQAARQEYVLADVLEARTGKLHFAGEARRVVDLALHVLLSQMKDWTRAWMWVQRGKSRALLDMLYRSDEPPASAVGSLLSEPRLAQLHAEERAVRRDLGGLLDDSQRQSRLRRLEEIMAELRTSPLARSYIAFREGGTLVLDDVDDIFASEAGQRRPGVCVDWAATGQRLYILVRRAGEEAVVERLPLSLGDVKAFVDRHLFGATFRHTLHREPELLEEVSALIGPLAHLAKAGELLILSPTGPLHAIPLHALSLSGALLTERHPIAYTWSLGLTRHAILRRDAARRALGIRLFGDPTDDRKAARQLVLDLAQTLGVEATIGPAASRETLRQALLDSGALHFQGHAVSDASEPLQSHLKTSDGRLMAAEIIALRDVKAGLVTLGACGSGAAAIMSGDEPSGIVPSLLIAGAASTLATLWPVQEASAAFFMRHFYGSVARGLPKVDALKHAMKMTRAQPEFASPYHWAPYVLHGDWL
jgi:hypothetical protein